MITHRHDFTTSDSRIHHTPQLLHYGTQLANGHMVQSTEVET
jgi:hypothetical protein